jgi:hypothetical protein
MNKYFSMLTESEQLLLARSARARAKANAQAGLLCV